MHKRIAIAAAAALVACGGGSSWVDPTTGNFSAQDSTDVMATISGSFGAALQQQPGSQTPAQARRAVAVNPPPQNCALSGNVAVTGNMDASCSSSTACSFAGQLHLALNSCSSVTGVVANGGLDIGASGSTNGNAFSLHETIQGGITVTRNGTLVGTCGINVSVDMSSNGTTNTVHVSGTICKQPVAQ
ncbi:MAG TPA: hypothetical protein VF994_14970 [Myxococcales bacterium]